MIICERSEVISRAKGLRDIGENLITVGGCFDLLHVGHVELLREARKLKGFVWVIMNTDDSLSRIKPGRPIVTFEERSRLVDAIRYVDFVSPFSEDTPCRILSDIKPSIHVKGADYENVPIPESQTVYKYGGKVVFLPLVEGVSTTKIIKKIRGAQE